jgi:uncharacterized protein (DUF58 family)
MQRRNSVQNSYYFSLLLVGVVLSAVSRRLEPLYVVLPLVIALLYSRLTRVEPRLTVHCHVAPLRVFEGDHIGVRIAVRAETALPPTEHWHLLGAHFSA